MHHPDLVRFLAWALSHAGGSSRIDLGAMSATDCFRGLVVEVAPSVRVGVAITTDSVDRLRLEVGSQSVAIVKSTDVIVGKG